jgi:hypothetical protein
MALPELTICLAQIFIDMRELICNNCKESKKEIEFNYLYIKKQYSKICKQCESQTKSMNLDPGNSDKISPEKEQ